MLRKLWNDEAGFVISSELVLIATVLVIGLLVGMVSLRDQVIQELGDVADAISELTQSYSFAGVEYHTGGGTPTATTAGSMYNDLGDFCDSAGTEQVVAGTAPNCIGLDVAADVEDEM